jgi:sugar lactone lactonase YvrE
MDGKAATGFREVSRIGGKGPDPGQFSQELRGIAVDGHDRLHAVGDSVVKIFDGDGRLLQQFETGLPGFSVAVDGDGRIWVGQWQQVEIYDGQGGLVDTWRDTERLGLITAIGLDADDVFLADASARCIHRYDRHGTLLNHIGDKHRKGGFHIPNGVVDFAIDRQGILHVANPGMHRVERYRSATRPPASSWGTSGASTDRTPRVFPAAAIRRT